MEDEFDGNVGTTEEVLAEMGKIISQADDVQKYDQQENTQILPDTEQTIGTQSAKTQPLSPRIETEERQPPSLQDTVVELDKKLTEMRREFSSQTQQTSFQHQQELENLKREYESKLQRYVPIDELLSNPEMALARHGARFDDLAQRIINQNTNQNTQGRLDPVVQHKVSSQEETIKSLQEKINLMEQQVHLQRIDSQVDVYLRDPKYSLLENYYDANSGTGIHQTVQRVMGQTLNQTGKLLTVPEALDKITEARLTEAKRLLENPVIAQQFGLAQQLQQNQQKQIQTSQVSPDQQRVPQTNARPGNSWSPSDVENSLSSEELLEKFKKQLEQSEGTYSDLWGE